MGRPFTPRDRLRERGPDTRIRINDGITARSVRLIDEKGQQAGVKSLADALDYAAGVNLDLVEVAPQADPPVCRVMNFSKYRYEQELKAKQARKHQSTIVIKEIKLRPKIGDADYETKKSHVVRFLEHKDKVKVTIMFRGREVFHPELGKKILDRIAGVDQPEGMCSAGDRDDIGIRPHGAEHRVGTTGLSQFAE